MRWISDEQRQLTGSHQNWFMESSVSPEDFLPPICTIFFLITRWGWDKMAATLADDTFKYKFVNEKFFLYKFHLSLFLRAQHSNISSDNVLAPSRQQTIIWTDDGIVYWRIYASLSLNELKDTERGRLCCDFIWQVIECDLTGASRVLLRVIIWYLDWRLLLLNIIQRSKYHKVKMSRSKTPMTKNNIYREKYSISTGCAKIGVACLTGKSWLIINRVDYSEESAAKQILLWFSIKKASSHQGPFNYHQTSNMSRTKYQNLNVSGWLSLTAFMGTADIRVHVAHPKLKWFSVCLAAALPNPLKPGVNLSDQ